MGCVPHRSWLGGASLLRVTLIYPGGGDMGACGIHLPLDYPVTSMGKLRHSAQAGCWERCGAPSPAQAHTSPPPPLPAWGGGFPTHPTDPTGREDAQHPPKARTHSREGDSRAQPWGRVGGKGPPPQFPWGLPRVQPEPVVSPPSPPTISLPTGSPPHHGEGLGPVGRKPPPPSPPSSPLPLFPHPLPSQEGKDYFFLEAGRTPGPASLFEGGGTHTHGLLELVVVVGGGGVCW